MKKALAVTTGMAVAGGLFMAGPVGAAVAPTDTVTQFMFPMGLGEGLVTMVQGSTSELAFSLSGFRPNTRYTLTVSSRGCSSSKGVLARQSFRTDGRGLGWDPVGVRASARPKSVRLTQGKRPLVCNPLALRLGHPVTTIKVTAPKGLLTVSQTPDEWQVALAVGDLKRSAAYRFVGLQGGCAGTVIVDVPTRSNRRGFATLDFKRTPIRDKSMDAAGMVDPATGQQLFCQNL